MVLQIISHINCEALGRYFKLIYGDNAFRTLSRAKARSIVSVQQIITSSIQSQLYHQHRETKSR